MEQNKCRVCGKYTTEEFPAIAEFEYNTPEGEVLTVDVIMRTVDSRELAYACTGCFGIILATCAGSIAAFEDEHIVKEEATDDKDPG